MPSLDDLQAGLRRAVVSGDADGVVRLIGGCDPQKRLAIHHRHYETSLITTLLGKFPATVWLAGSPFVTEAARQFVHACPPHSPCIAEYGVEFPEFLSARPGAERVPYLRAFAELEWHLGCVAIAVDQKAVVLEDLSAIGSDALTDAVLTVQPRIRYLQAAWPVDELMRLYLTESAPEKFWLPATPVWMEIRGARGVFQIGRPAAGDFVFRRAIQQARPVGEAAERALEADAGFDPGRALTALIAENLVTGILACASRIAS